MFRRECGKRRIMVLLLVWIIFLTMGILYPHVNLTSKRATLDTDTSVIKRMLDTGMDTLDTENNDTMKLIPNSDSTVTKLAIPKKPIKIKPCKCKTWFVSRAEFVRKNLDAHLSWLNLTVKEELRRRHPNLPVDFLYQATYGRVCALIPQLLRIKWINQYWQKTQLSDGSNYYAYSAFIDPNIGNEDIGGGGGVRVLGVTSALNPPHDWCHFWFSAENPPLISRVTSAVYIDPMKKNIHHRMLFMLTCPMPPGTQQPIAVSIVPKPCAMATNILKVEGSLQRLPTAYKDGVIPKDQKSYNNTTWVPAVCGPALYYYSEDFSWRLVEWLEVLRAQGFGQVFLYHTDVHPNIDKVLRHYEDEGFITVTEYKYPPHYVNQPSFRNLFKSLEPPRMWSSEQVYFNDCLLRHMHQYRFIAHYDPDEVPMLPGYDSFPHLVREYEKMTRDQPDKIGFRLIWSFFYDEPEEQLEKGPNFLHVMRRTHHYSGGVFNGKPLLDMDKTRGITSHYPTYCTFGTCGHRNLEMFSKKKAYLAHYKPNCWGSCENNHISGSETWLLQYKTQVTRNVEQVLRNLDLL